MSSIEAFSSRGKCYKGANYGHTYKSEQAGSSTLILATYSWPSFASSTTSLAFWLFERMKFEEVFFYVCRLRTGLQSIVSLSQAEYEHPFSGWDFSYLDGRWVEDWSALTWDYRAAIEARLPTTRSLLDLGTGGGEFLALLEPLPADTCATEGYAPNVLIARKRLEPLGVRVYEIAEDLLLPLEHERFELVIDRHEAYLPREVLRILKPGGLFLTQQVDGGDHDEDLHQLLGASICHIRPEWHLSYAVNELEDAGFENLEQ